MYLTGRHPQKLDAKGRLTIPAPFREALADGLYITLDFTNCLLIFPRAKLESIMDKLESLPSTNNALATYRDKVVFNAQLSSLDSMGRVLIPAVLREEAGINQDVNVVGDISVIRIFTPENWENRAELRKKVPAEILDELSKFGI